MKKQLIALLFLPVLFCSCSHYYYVPNSQNVPLFREKNEYRFQEHLQEVRNLPLKNFRLHIRSLIILVSWQISCRPKGEPAILWLYH